MGEFANKAKGKIKQAAGILTGNDKLKQEGEADERKGQVEGAAKDLKNAVKSAKSAINEIVK